MNTCVCCGSPVRSVGMVDAVVLQYISATGEPTMLHFGLQCGCGYALLAASRKMSGESHPHQHAPIV